MNKRNQHLKKLPAAIAIVMASTAVYGQNTTTLEEIIITAERRETALQSTPAAITAMTGELIESANINNLNELTLTTPGISIQGINRNQQYISMRGNITESGDAGIAQSIGFFIDGLYFGRSSLFNQSLADVERVEVLRGPQGQLWGHNIVGGSLNVITRDPTQENEADLKVTMGNYDRIELAGRIAGGLTDNLAGQISFSSETADGYVTNLDSGQDLGSEDVQLVRGKLVWDVSDKLTAKLSATYQQDNSGMNARNFVPGPDVIRTPPPPGTLAPILSSFSIPTNYEEETHQRSLIGTNDFEVKVLSLDLQYELDNGMTLSSLTGSVNSDGFVDNFGFFPFPDSFGQFERDHAYDDSAFSQEFRLAGGEDTDLFWQVGAYYYDATNEQRQSSGTFGLPFTRAFANNVADTEGNGDGQTLFTDFASSDTESMALFGQATWSINDWLSLTGGLRYTDVDKSFNTVVSGEAHRRIFQDQANDCTAVVVGVPRSCLIQRNESNSWTNTSPKVTLDGQWDEVGPFNSLLAYATYSEGWKEGGFQTPNANAQNVAEFAITPESAENIEFGVKTRFWNNRATFNASYFSTDYEGQQTSLFVNNLLQTFNLDSEIDGFEIDGGVAVTEWLTLNYSGAFYDAEYSAGASVGPNPTDSVAGNDTVGTPETSYTIGWDAGTFLDNGAEVFFSGSYSFTDSIESDPNNPLRAADLAGLNVSSFSEAKILNATLGIRKDNWEVSLWGRNLTDEYILTNIASFSDFWLTNAWAADNPSRSSYEGTRTEPRMYGLSVRWTY